VDGVHLYWGQDRIAFVEGLAPASARTSASTSASTSTSGLDVYWDFSSPFAYLGATQVAALAMRTGARVTWRPLLLGGLFRSIGTPDVPLATFSPAKQRYIVQDLERWAAYLGLPYRFPSRFPVSSLRALRVYLALPEAHQEGYREAAFRACWAEDRDISDDAVLASCIGDAQVAKDAFAKADSAEIKAALRTATEHAAAQGVFGVPTFVAYAASPSGHERDLFWGQDRLDLVEDALLSSVSRV
jgi:2-hydroxychromene-2-carboxylate isomerase